MSPDALSSQPRESVVSDEQAGTRLDVYLTAIFPQYSRSRLRKAILDGGVTVDATAVKPSHRLRGGSHVVATLPPLSPDLPEPEDIPLDILYQDDAIVAINKSSGMIVHPAKGHWSGTLTAALAFHFDRLSSAGGPTRPGIVHRLDRDTSGVIVVAKTDTAHHRLAEQFAARSVQKEYFALVRGNPDRDADRIDRPIGVHPHQREKMAIRENHRTSRAASTFYELVERFDGFAAVRVLPKTGRTHQIRVHLAHVGCPVLCDPLYSGASQITEGRLRRRETEPAVLLQRAALHARRLRIVHPETGRPIEFAAPIPADMQAVLDCLRECRAL